MNLKASERAPSPSRPGNAKTVAIETADGTIHIPAASPWVEAFHALQRLPRDFMEERLQPEHQERTNILF